MKKPKLSGAFTLIEVLIVVLIIGTLACLAVPAYQGFIIRAKLAEIFPTVSAIVKAEQLYYLERGNYWQIWGPTSNTFFESGLGIAIPEKSNCIYEVLARSFDVPNWEFGVTVRVSRKPSTGSAGGLCYYHYGIYPDGTIFQKWGYLGEGAGGTFYYDEWCLYLALPDVERMRSIPH